jgi:hypothetical protein
MFQTKQNKNRRSFGDQVRLLAPQIKSRAPQLPRITEIGNDGWNHINIWEDGDTQLGRALSHMAHLPFTHSTLGAFSSIEGLWFYVQAQVPDEALRTKSGLLAHSAGRRVKTKQIEDFRVIIAQANWEKINAYPDLAADMLATNLRFEKYYIVNSVGPDNGKRQRTVNSPWMIAMFEEIRYALFHKIDPDFSFLTDAEQDRIQNAYRSQGSNSDILNVYKSNQPAPVFPEIVKAEAPKPLPKKKKWKDAPKGTYGAKSEVKETEVISEVAQNTTSLTDISVADQSVESTLDDTAVLSTLSHGDSEFSCDKRTNLLSFGEMEWKPEATMVAPISIQPEQETSV